LIRHRGNLPVRAASAPHAIAGMTTLNEKMFVEAAQAMALRVVKEGGTG